MNNGPERQNEDEALNAKWEMNDDSERQMRNERWLWTPSWEMMMMALNAKTKSTALNAKTEDERWLQTSKENEWLWTPNGKRGYDGSECQNWKYDSERQTGSNSYEYWAEIVTLNAKLNWINMNVKLRRTTLNVITRKTWRLWIPNCKGMTRWNMP